MVFCFREKEDQKYEVECRQAKGEPEEAPPTMSVRNTPLIQILTNRSMFGECFAHLSAMFPEITGPIKRPKKYDVLR